MFVLMYVPRVGVLVVFVGGGSGASTGGASTGGAGVGVCENACGCASSGGTAGV